MAILLVAVLCRTSILSETAVKKGPNQGNPPHPLTQQVGGYWSANHPAATSEGYETHHVKNGDTLWDITRQYLKDPFLWPQVWEANPNIKNPHWIYPGDQILIKKVSVVAAEPTAAPPVSAVSSTPPPSAPPAANTPQEQVAEPPSSPEKPATQAAGVATYTDLYCAGFFNPERISPKAELIGGEESESKSRFSDRDVVYLNQGTANGIKPGDELQVVRNVKEFAKWGIDFGQANKPSRYGYYYQDVGRLRVILAQENSATAEVIFACEEMMVKDLIVPAEQRTSPPQRTATNFDKFMPSNGKAAGKVFMSKDFRKLLGSGHVVYVDLGSKDNVQVGDYLRITRHFEKNNISLFNRDDYRRFKTTFDSLRKVIGEAVVLRVDPSVSTALITYSNYDVTLGDGVELE
jgi:hypothetical protein